MPTVPRAPTTTGRIGFTPTAAPGAIVGLSNQRAQVFEQVAVIGAQQAARDNEFDARRERQRAKEEANNAFASFSRGLGDFSAEVVNSDDIAGILPTFETQSEAMRLSTAEGITSEAAQNAFLLASEDLITAQRATVRGKQFEREQAAGKASLQANITDLTSSIVSSDNDVVKQQLIESGIDMLMDTEHILSENRSAAVDKFLTNIDIGTVLSLVDLADSSDDELVAIGHLDMADAFLKDPESTRHLAPEQRTELRRRVESERKDAVSRFNIGEVRKLSNDIASARTPEEFDEITGRIGLMLDEGLLTDEGAARWDAQLRTRNATLQSADNGAVAVQFALEIGIPLDPQTDQKAFDDYYENVFLPDLAGKSPEEAAESVLALVETSDLLPSAVERDLRAAGNSDNPILVAQAAQQFIAFREASPQSVERFTDAEAIKLENIDEAIRLNVPAAEALEREREIQKLSPSVVKGRQQAHSFAQGEQTDAEWLFENRATFEISKGFFQFDVGVEEIDPGVAETFSAEVRRLHTLDPNIEKAHERALRTMARAWGVTAVGESGFDAGQRLMYLAPETMYKGFGGDSAEITRQLVVDVRGADIGEVAGLNNEELASRLILNADSDSLREFDEKGALTPGYSVWFASGVEDVAPTILLGPDSLPIRFYPEPKIPLEALIAREVAVTQENIARSQRDHESGKAVRAAQRLGRRGEEVAEELIETIPGLVVPRSSVKRQVVKP